ncbi:MAG: hypothetical protein JO266_18160 [Acidobacteria bacterium]|nr:hypothetical protein [Acidobacteriota bacterium]
MRKNLTTPDRADAFFEAYMDGQMKAVQSGEIDANDYWYAFNASRDYDPSPDLEKIKAAVMFVNSSDDFINPPELGIAEHEIERVKRGKFVLIAASEKTHGHGTHTLALLWEQYLRALMAESQQ